jgi:ABC-type branched-subunit amino acid transport system substrate-binding protein
LTGPLASDGQEMKNGVTLAAEQINAAGSVAGKTMGRIHLRATNRR